MVTTYRGIGMSPGAMGGRLSPVRRSPYVAKRPTIANYPGRGVGSDPFRPSMLDNNKMSLLQQGTDMLRGPVATGLLGAMDRPETTTALAGLLGDKNPIGRALGALSKRDTDLATIAGRAGKQTSAIDNYNFLQQLIEKGAPQKDIDTFRNMIKRGANIVDDGTHLIAYDTRTGQEIYRIRKDPTHPTEEAGMVKGAEKEAERVA